jgi:hypothetical protein
MGNPRNTERKPIGASEVQHGLHFFFFFFMGSAVTRNEREKSIKL